jgi:hypothetical protein
MSGLDPEDIETIAGKFGISDALTREIVHINDHFRKDPVRAFKLVREWAQSHLKDGQSPA